MGIATEQAGTTVATGEPAAAAVIDTGAQELTSMADQISADLFPSKDGDKPLEGELVEKTEPEKVTPPPKKEEPVVATITKRDPPKTWRAEAIADWDKTPEKVQEEILKREDDMFKGLEGYKQNAGIGKAVLDVMKPYLPTLEKAGINPLQQISGLMHAHFTLSTGTPEQKQQMFQAIAKEYGVYAGPGKDGAVDTYVDPQVDRLLKKVSELESKLNTREQTELTARQNTLQEQVNKFADDPAHPYFDEVADDITAFLRKGETLESAYEKAVWANPQTRAKEQARLQAEAAKAKEAEATKKAAQAKRATGANVKSAPKPAGATTGVLGSMDDTLSETLAAIKSRA